jgi:predicted MFS family arabinose efflux permease
LNNPINLVVLAFAISQLNGVGGLKGWQWIFLLEGIPSIFIAFLCIKYFPDSPQHAYFFTAKEKFIAASRIVIKEDSSSFNMKECLVGLFHPRTLAFGILGFCACTPMYSFSFLMPTMVKNLGYSSLTAQLLTSPPYVAGFFFSTFFASHSDKTERRFHLIAIFLGSIVCFTLMNILTGMPKYIIINFCVCFAISGLPVALAWHNEVLGLA